MSAQDNLSPQQFFHGTRNYLMPGTSIVPGHGGGLNGVPMDHVYATNSPHEAAAYAYAVPSPDDDDADDTPRVYEVRPTGVMHDDSEDGGAGAWKSREPMKVVRHVGNVVQTGSGTKSGLKIQ